MSGTFLGIKVSDYDYEKFWFKNNKNQCNAHGFTCSKSITVISILLVPIFIPLFHSSKILLMKYQYWLIIDYILENFALICHHRSNIGFILKLFE